MGQCYSMSGSRPSWDKADSHHHHNNNNKENIPPSPASSSTTSTSTTSSGSGATTPSALLRADPRRVGHISHEYLLMAKLGAGSTATVFEAVSRRDNKTYAIKCFDKEKMKVYHLLWLKEEVSILAGLDHHRHTIRVHDFLEDQHGYYVVMDYIKGGELLKHVRNKGKYEEEQAKKLFHSLLLAIQHLHHNHIVHRDLKPANILLQEGEEEEEGLRLADFGFAAHTYGDGDTLTGVCGTVWFIAPEILKRERYGKAVDMWSCGVILYYLLSGQQPFKHKNPRVLKENIMKGDYNFQHLPPTTSAAAKDLISRLLTVEPSKRFTATQALHHPWLAGTSSSSTTTSASSTSTSTSTGNGWAVRVREKLRVGLPRVVISTTTTNTTRNRGANAA